MSNLSAPFLSRLTGMSNVLRDKPHDTQTVNGQGRIQPVAMGSRLWGRWGEGQLVLRQTLPKLFFLGAGAL